jgi:hypothetical protein
VQTPRRHVGLVDQRHIPERGMAAF